ncbi:MULTISPECIES: hypothetical protein [unclassified Flavobacterium]|uniref:hypothetical protein n=1 Tax=unclassified Flavobacterium TaxID=196869 RepID=UPI0025BB2DA1|nr:MULTISPECIES: hypothetical protein [unclassified Flavobacterium]
MEKAFREWSMWLQNLHPFRRISKQLLFLVVAREATERVFKKYHRAIVTGYFLNMLYQVSNQSSFISSGICVGK